MDIKNVASPGLSCAPRVAPIVKWAGGKTQLLPELVPRLPPDVGTLRYIEPFFGGGALFFSQRPARALLGDVHPQLCAMYEAVRDRVSDVIAALHGLAEAHSAENYYRIRERFNRVADAAAHDRAAMFLYLNRTCYNGLHRVNRHGEFNVPVGRYDSPRIVDEPKLRAVSAELRRAELRCSSFETLLEQVRCGDFVYLDPPYAPASSTAGFTQYAASSFDDERQRALAATFRELDRRGCALMLSSSDVPRVHRLYAGHRIERVAARRSINSVARRRGHVTELVIRNF